MTTVREVLEDGLRGYADEEQIAGLIADLREVLSTGEGWVPRELRADQVEAGDVLVDKRERLWSVAETGSATGGRVTIRMVRGERSHEPAFAPGHKVAVLVTRTDRRALALLEVELGAQVVGREVRA